MEEKIKVAFLINSLDTGGVEMVLLNYVKGLSNYKNIDVKIITNKNNDTFIKNEILKYNPVYSLLPKKKLTKIKFINKLYSSYSRNKKLSSLLYDTDLIIDFLDADFNKYIKKIKLKKITFLHSSYKKLIINKKGISKKLYDYDKIITVCNDMMWELKELEPELSYKTDMIYNPLNFEHIADSATNHDNFNKLEDKLINSTYIVTVARLDETSKDIATLLKSLELLKNKEGLAFNTIIIGDGPDRKRLETLSEELKISDYVYFLGEKTNPYVWMKNAQFLIHSSKYEGFCLVLAEALSLGCNVIATDCPVGPREILNDGLYGDLCEVGNIGEMASIISKNILNENNKHDFFKKEKYSIERSCLQLLNKIEDLKNDTI